MKGGLKGNQPCWLLGDRVCVPKRSGKIHAILFHGMEPGTAGSISKVLTLIFLSGKWGSNLSRFFPTQFNRLDICFRFHWFFVSDVICKCLPLGSILVKRFVMTLLKSRWCSSHRSPSLKRFWQCYMMFFCKSQTSLKHYHIYINFTSGRPKDPRIFAQNSSSHEFLFEVRRWLPPSRSTWFYGRLKYPVSKHIPKQKEGMKGRWWITTLYNPL